MLTHKWARWIRNNHLCRKNRRIAIWDKNSPTSGRKISRWKIPLAIVLKIEGVVDFPHKLGKSFWMKSSLASQLVATRRKRGCKFAIPLLIVGFEGYGQKCPILVIGRKSALSPKLDRVDLLIFENVQGSWTRSKMYEFNFRSFLRERQMGQREDEISSPLQYQICPPRNNLAAQFWAVKLLVYLAQSNGEQIVHCFE